MAFPILAAALGLAQFAPAISRWLGGSNAQDVAAKVLDIAQKITETPDPLEAIQRMQDNADMVIDFQKAVIDLETELTLAIDRQDARLRDMALAKAGRSNVRADVMVIAAALGLILCLATLGRLLFRAFTRRGHRYYLYHCRHLWRVLEGRLYLRVWFLTREPREGLNGCRNHGAVYGVGGLQIPKALLR